MERGETEKRKVDPYHLVFRGGQFYLIGHSHEREAVRVFRLSRIQGKVGYASKAEHDFSPPEDFDRRDYGSRADWQLGETRGTAKIFIRERIAWLIERDFGAYGELRAGEEVRRRARQGLGLRDRLRLAARADRLGPALAPERRRCSAPDELREEAESRLGLLHDRHDNGFEPAEIVDRPLREAPRRARSNGRGEAAIRPERFARLVTLAGMLIEAAKKGERLQVAELRQRLELTDEELREDIELLNVVNFGGGTYVLYAEIIGDEIEVDSEPYGDNFARPARLLPLEAKALVAAIDLFGDHLPQADLQKRAREDRQRARPRPLRGGAGDRLRRRRRRRGRAHGQRGDRRQPGARAPVLQGERGPVHRALGRALPARERARGLVRRVLRPDQRGRPPLQARPDQGGDALRARRFEPRPEVEELAGVEGWMTHGEVPTAARRPRLGLARAGPLAARGAHRGRGAGRRRRRRRAALRRQAPGWCARSSAAPATWSCSSPRTPARRSPKRSPAERPCIEPPWRTMHVDRRGARAPRDPADRRAEPGADDAGRDQHLPLRGGSLRGDRPGARGRGPPRGDPRRGGGARRDRRSSCSPTRHGDHAAGADRLGAEVVLPGGGEEHGGLRALATPGHAADHVCFLTADGVCFSGDLVLGARLDVRPARRRLARRLHGLAARCCRPRRSS